MKTYDIICTNGSHKDLVRLVNEAIEKGYTPIGGPINMGGDGCKWVGQAVILKSSMT